MQCNAVLILTFTEYNRFAMQVREAVIPNQVEPAERPTRGWEKLEKDLMVLSFHMSPCARPNTIKCPLVAAFITMSIYLE